MSIFTKLFSSKPDGPRVHVCSECGMPVAEHKEWCSILRGQATLGREEPSTKESRGI